MNMIKPTLASALLGLSALSFAVHAQTVMTPKEIDTQYKSDQKRCDALKGNDKDVCQQQAKATRDNAKADAKQAKEQAESRHDATKEKRANDYKVATEKCDAMSGNAKDACMADAKTRYGK